MSLLDEFKDTYIVMNQEDSDDEFGSYNASYSESEIEFEGSLGFTESHIQSEVESLGLKENYKLLIPKDVCLSMHQVIKRKSDGKFFRVTSDSSNVFTPASSPLNLRFVTVEGWSLEDNSKEEEEEDD